MRTISDTGVYILCLVLSCAISNRRVTLPIYLLSAQASNLTLSLYAVRLKVISSLYYRIRWTVAALFNGSREFSWSVV